MSEPETQMLDPIPAHPISLDVKNRFRAGVAVEMAAARDRLNLAQSEVNQAKSDLATWERIQAVVDVEVPDPAPYRIGNPPYSDSDPDATQTGHLARSS